MYDDIGAGSTGIGNRMKDMIGQNRISRIEPAIANLARQLGIDIYRRRPCDNGRLGMLRARLFIAGLAGRHDEGR